MKVTKTIFNEMIDMKKSGVSSGVIAAKFSLGYSTVKNLTKGIGPNAHYKINPTKMTKEKARIHAALASEGCKHKSLQNYYNDAIIKNKKFLGYKKVNLLKPSKTVKLIFTNYNKKFLKRFIKDVKKVYDYTPTKNKKDGTELTLCSNISKDLLKLSDFGSRKWYIPNEIVNASNSIKKEWLKVYFDAEGTVEFDIKHRIKRICVGSVNKRALRQVQYLLNSFSIKSNLNENLGRLIIARKEDLLKYYSKIGFYIKEKNNKLKKICKSLEKYSD